jgi:tRNA threonylcarbamoyl adenosine modification protein YeaZ
MKILGIETATVLCGVALIEGDPRQAETATTIAEYRLNIKNVHSEKLVSMVKQVLSDAHSDIEEIDGLAISIGPGSYTGLRIGLSAAKGLAYASGKPLIAVSTLEALAYRVGLLANPDVDTEICPMLDARRDEVYYAFYRWERDRLRYVSDPRAGSISDILPNLKPLTIIVGEGSDKARKYGARCTFPSAELQVCSAVSVAQIGMKELLCKQPSDIRSMEPTYLKDFIADRSKSSGANG